MGNWTLKRVIRGLKNTGNLYTKKAIKGALDMIPLSSWRTFQPKPLISIFYHLVSDEKLPHIATLFKYKNTNEFENDLRFLSENFEVLSYEDLKRVIKENFPPHQQPYLHLSFDDGLRECYDNVIPLLQKYKVPATFFINSDLLDNRALLYRHKASLCIDRLNTMTNDRVRSVNLKLNKALNLHLSDKNSLSAWLYMATFKEESEIEKICESFDINWKDFLRRQRPYMTIDQVKSIHACGHTLGAHTRNHKRLSLITSKNELKTEIIESCKDIQSITQQKEVSFAFPFSGHGINREVFKDIYSDYPCLGLVFEATGLGLEKSWLVKRLGCDRPPDKTLSASQSNIEEFIRKEYVNQYARV